MQLSEAMERSSNNFDLMRLVAAWVVLASHSYALTGSPGEPVALLLGYEAGGGLAVDVFFVISGFLVTRSRAARGLAAYAASRALRVVPALTALVVFDVAVGALQATCPVGDFLTDRLTLKHLLGAVPFVTTVSLPCLFADLPVARTVNGSLWTLPIESLLYVIVGLAGLAVSPRRPAFAGLAVLAAAGFAAAVAAGLSYDNLGPVFRYPVKLPIHTYQFLRLAVFFALGAACFTLADRVVLDGRWAALALAALLASGLVPYGFAVAMLTIPYLVLYAAYALPATDSLLRPVGDLSYGVYLYAFPVQQSVVNLLGREVGPWGVTLIATPVVLVLAWLSWRLVERPALRRRGRLGGQGAEPLAASA